MNLPWHRLPWVVVQWSAFVVLKYFVLTPIGLLMCAPFCGRPCEEWPQPFRFFGTEDGGNPERWGERPRPQWATRWPWLGRYWYTSIRNHVGGLDNLFSEPKLYQTYGSWLDTAMEPKDLGRAGKDRGLRWRVAGWMDGIRYVRVHGDGTYSEVWVGFQIGSPVSGLGFTAQVRRHRPLPR